MGALTYEPDRSPAAGTGTVDLDALARDAEQVYEGETVEGLATLLKLGGSPGGARPKVLLGLSPSGERIVHGVDDLPDDYRPVIVKFPSPDDDPTIGAVEAAYADMARAAGIDVPPTRLLPAEHGPGYFAVERFDRDDATKRHSATFAGLFHADHRLPSVDYADLLKGTGWLTRDRRAVDQHFRRMVFNVLAHNRDDHTKNHGYLMDRDGQWTLAPAYDLTPSFGPGGEHALAVGGDGRQPGRKDILSVAAAVGISRDTTETTITVVAKAVAKWPVFAASYGLGQTTVASVAELHERAVVESV